MGLRIGVGIRGLGFAAVAALFGCGHVDRAPKHTAAPGGAGGADSVVGAAAGATDDAAGAGGAGSTSPVRCQDGAALAKARLWQLTDAQYVNAVSQLFGVTVGPEVSEVDVGSGDFANYSEDRVVTAPIALHYLSAAKDVARQAVTSHYATFMPCGDGLDCAEQFLKNRIARAFGHRLDDKETARYLALFKRGDARSPQDGVRLMIEAALQSPSFLYRSELGPNTSGGPRGQVLLTSPQVATLLAMSFTNSLPDDELWEKGDTGALADPAVLEAEVARLLTLPQTKDNLGDLASYWLGVQKVPNIQKDAALFPELTPELKKSLYDGSRLFVRDLVTSGSVDDLVQSNAMYVNASLASVYGIPGVKAANLQLLHVDLPERQFGVLSQPAILAASSLRVNGGDVVHRGLFLYNSLICGAPPAPPPVNEASVSVSFPPDATDRERAVLRAQRADCSSCHNAFDPLGLLSERYDPIGRYHEADANGPIDQSAVLSLLGPDLDGPTNGFAELAAKLIKGRRLSDCAAQNLAGMTLGRDDVTHDTSCALSAVKDALEKTGKFSDFYRALATSPAFIRRDAE